jgi:hypothetical protein
MNLKIGVKVQIINKTKMAGQFLHKSKNSGDNSKKTVLAPKLWSPGRPFCKPNGPRVALQKILVLPPKITP